MTESSENFFDPYNAPHSQEEEQQESKTLTYKFGDEMVYVQAARNIKVSSSNATVHYLGTVHMQ